MKKKSAIPLMMEFEVNPDTAPFLVTGSKAVLWVTEAHPGDVVKAAVRPLFSLGGVFAEMIEAVIAMEEHAKWGSVEPFSREGFDKVRAHLEYYELGDLELLVPRERGEDNEKGTFARPLWMNTVDLNCPLRPSSWLPDNRAVLVPRDRGFVGFAGEIPGRNGVAVLHNASRAVGILKGEG